MSAPPRIVDADPRFRVRGIGVGKLLRKLVDNHTLVTAYPDGTDVALVTALLDVDRNQGLVILGRGPDEAVNRRAVDGGRLLCVSHHDAVELRFALDGVREAVRDGDTVLVAPLPPMLVRLQRREAFRVPALHLDPVRIALPEGTLYLPLEDISAGGLALLDVAGTFHLQPGEAIRDCLLALPDSGRIPVDLEVRYRRPCQHNGNTATRVGCRFLDLPHDRAAAIQRFVNRLQVTGR